MVKFFQLHHRKQLLLDGGVVSLGLINCLASIRDDIRLLVSSLPQNHLERMITSIRHNLERKAPIRRLNDRGGDEGRFDPIKILRHSLLKTKGVSLTKSKARGLAILENP